MKRTVGHTGPCRFDRRLARVAATDDVAVLGKRQQQFAATTVHVKDTGAGADVERLGDVLSEVEAGFYFSSAVTLMTAVSIDTDESFVPAGTRNGNAHW